MTLQRGGDVVAGHPIRRGHLQRPVGDVVRNEASIPCSLRRRLPLRRGERHGAGQPKFQGILVDDGRTGTGTDERREQGIESGRHREDPSAAHRQGTHEPRPRIAAAIAGFDPQSRADQAFRDACLQAIAVGCLTPVSLDARFGRGMIDAVVAVHEGLRLDQPFSGGGEEIRLQRPVRPARGEVDPVEAVMFRVDVGGFGIEPGVVHLQVDIQVTIRETRQESRPQIRCRRQRGGLGGEAPVLAVAVEQGLIVERIHINIAEGRCERLSVRHVPQHRLRLRRQRMGDRAGTGLQRVFLRPAQGGLQLAGVLATGPRQDQRGERDQEQLKADAHPTQR